MSTTWDGLWTGCTATTIDIGLFWPTLHLGLLFKCFNIRIIVNWEPGQAAGTKSKPHRDPKRPLGHRFRRSPRGWFLGRRGGRCKIQSRFWKQKMPNSFCWRRKTIDSPRKPSISINLSLFSLPAILGTFPLNRSSRPLRPVGRSNSTNFSRKLERPRAVPISLPCLPHPPSIHRALLLLLATSPLQRWPGCTRMAVLVKRQLQIYGWLRNP